MSVASQGSGAAVYVSVVVRAFNEERDLGRLLEGIYRQKVSFEFEVVLVDSGSTDRTLEIARGYPVRVTHILPEEFSFGRSLNRGIAAARGEICAIVSAHCYPMHEDWLANLVAPFEDGRIALVYGKQRGGICTKYSEEQIFARWFPEQSVDDYRVPFANNANSAVRRSIWEEYPFDEDLTGLEDLDWVRRVRSDARRISYRADAGVHHVHDETQDQTYQRYYREALAYREIYPNETFRFSDFVRFFALNTAGDLLHALRDGCATQHLAAIPAFRYAQFLATYRAHSRSSISKEMQRQLYYPRAPRLFRREAGPVSVAPVSSEEDAANKLVIHDITRPLKRKTGGESQLSFNLHSGTHIDAPFRAAEGGARLAAHPLELLIGEAVVLEHFGAGRIEVDFFSASELAPGTERVLLRTQNSLAVGDSDRDFVALSVASAEWLVARGVKLVGVDGPSVQPDHDPDSRVKEVLLAAGVVLLAGLDLAQVVAGHYRLVALPLSIQEAEGAPVRAVLLDEGRS